MSEKIKNAAGQLFYGLHMIEGLAEYKPPGQDPFRVLIAENAIKKMDPTFTGKHVYVGHVDDVDYNDPTIIPDGYVVRSFFNKADGKHWCEFMVTTEKGMNAIRNGWKLSNCYIPNAETMKGAGTWHGLDYSREVTDGEYEHLAIVQSPRYQESIILTPEQFKAYNKEKEDQLKQLSNSTDKETKKGESIMGKFNFFKRQKLENSVDLEDTIVELPKSKQQMSISDVISKYDERLLNGYHCNGDEIVKVGESSMSVNELVEKHMDLQNQISEEEKKKNAEEEEKKKNAEEEEKKKKENEDKAKKEEEEKKANEDKAKEEEAKKANSLEYYRKLANANTNIQNEFEKETFGELSAARVARGQSRYGSSK